LLLLSLLANGLLKMGLARPGRAAANGSATIVLGTGLREASERRLTRQSRRFYLIHVNPEALRFY